VRRSSKENIIRMDTLQLLYVDKCGYPMKTLVMSVLYLVALHG